MEKNLKLKFMLNSNMKNLLKKLRKKKLNKNTYKF